MRSIATASWRRGLRAAVLATAAIILCGTPSVGFAEASSSAADRVRFVSITRQLEAAPLAENLKADREWALTWLTEAPDVTVTVCQATLDTDERYPYSGEILIAYVYAMAAAIIEHPETAIDPASQQMAGLEGALRAYRAILEEKPGATLASLESLLALRAQGRLPDFVSKATATCLAQAK